MTDQEVLSEITKDLPALLRFSDRMDTKWRSAVIKRTIFPIYATFGWTSPSKNKWYLFYEARSKKEIGDNVRMITVATYDTNHGRYAIMVTFLNDKLQLITFTPHFFSRYKERVNIDIDGLELFKRYFKNNHGYAYNNTELGISGTTSEGVALGTLTSRGDILFKTFITLEMAKGEQVDIFKYCKEIYNDKHLI